MSCKRSLEIRDVGVALAQILQRDNGGAPLLLTDSILLRGPKIDRMTYEELGCPGTIINLRVESDDPSYLQGRGPAQCIHCPMGNESNVYDTQTLEVRTWLLGVYRHFEAPMELPILVHCKHGRDRTGVVVAVLLMILGVPKAAIMEEFELTDTAQRVMLQRAFDGITACGGIKKYFEDSLDLEAVRRYLPHLSLSQARENRTKFFKQAIKERQNAEASCEALLQACYCGLRLKPEDADAVDFHAAAGWALARLRRTIEARHAFAEGLALAAGPAATTVKKGVVEMIQRESNALGVEAAAEGSGLET